MWINFGVLFPLASGALDLHQPGLDRADHIARRLRNGFGWYYREYDECPFCPFKSPFLAQHWASMDGCQHARIQILRKALWEGLARLVRHPWVQSLVAAACGAASSLPSPEDIVWEPSCSLPMRLLLGGHIRPEESGAQCGIARLPCEGWVPDQIRRVAAAAAESPQSSARLRLALECHADRLILQQHCALWLRCIHDVRSI